MNKFFAHIVLVCSFCASGHAAEIAGTSLPVWVDLHSIIRFSTGRVLMDRSVDGSGAVKETFAVLRLISAFEKNAGNTEKYFLVSEKISYPYVPYPAGTVPTQVFELGRGTKAYDLFDVEVQKDPLGRAQFLLAKVKLERSVVAGGNSVRATEILRLRLPIEGVSDLGSRLWVE